MKNYKIIIIPTNDKIQVGDVVQIYNELTNKWQLCICKKIDAEGYELELNAVSVLIFHPFENKKIQKVHIYICDTSGEIKKTVKVYYDVINSLNNDPYLLVITTNDSSLPLPQLSEQAIKTILKHNGIIEDFDVEIYGGEGDDYYKNYGNIVLKQDLPKLEKGNCFVTLGKNKETVKESIITKILNIAEKNIDTNGYLHITEFKNSLEILFSKIIKNN